MWFCTMSRSAPAVFVIACAPFHAHVFGHRDLYIIDVAAVPNGLKDAIAETEDQDVLNGFFAQIVIDAVDLLFAEDPQQGAVERFGALQVIPKWFFDHNARPASGSLLALLVVVILLLLTIASLA